MGLNMKAKADKDNTIGSYPPKLRIQDEEGVKNKVESTALDAPELQPKLPLTLRTSRNQSVYH